MIANLKTRRFIKKVKVAVRRIRNIFLILFGLTIARYSHNNVHARTVSREWVM